MQRMADQSRMSLAAADIIGRSEHDARGRVESAGLAFRAVRPGGVGTADWCATRVTATLFDGQVREAHVG